jgi:hypothetical protein
MMKYVFILLLGILLMTNSNAQVASGCSIPQPLLTYYDEDVKHLALQRISFSGSPYTDSISIPYSLQDTIWKGLAAIYNCNRPERDSVFDIYCIHDETNLHEIYHYIYVAVDTTASWFPNWVNNNITTGIPAFDSLLATYGFSIFS